MKKQFQSKAVPQGTRTIWRCLSALFILFTFAIGQMWGADITVTPPTPNNASNPFSTGLYVMSVSGTGSKLSSGAITTSTNGAVITINFQATKSDMYIKTITFNSLGNGTLSSDDGTFDGQVFTATGNKNSVNVVLASASGKKGTVKVTNVVVNTGTNDVESITFTGASGSSATYTSSAATSALSSITTDGSFSVSSGKLSWANSKKMILTAESNIKYIAFSIADGKMYSTFSAAEDTYNSANYTWSGSSKTVTFTNGSGGGRDVKGLYVIIEPVVKHHVTYALGGDYGTTPTQADVAEGAKFTLHNGTTGITAPSGKQFAGWNDGSTTYLGSAEYTMGTSDVTLTAVWENAKTDPTATFSAGAYVVGESALDLSTLWSSNSDGAVTYALKVASEDATVSGTSFSATKAGSYVVTASQAATATYNAVVKEATITVTWPATGAATITYNLDVTNNGTTLQTLATTNATSSSISVAASTSLLYGGLTKSSSKGSHNGSRTLGINTLSAEDADKYFGVTFTVASGYEFTPSAISLKTLTIGGNATSYKAVLTDGVGSIVGTVDATSDSEVTLGSWTGLGTTTLSGTVTLKLYAWYTTSGSYNAYRLSTPITITGTVAVETPAETHHVTYDLNGGTGTTPTQADVAEGAKFTLHDGTTGITPVTGKVFAGWNDGTTTYDGGGEYTMGTSDVTLTAQWCSKPAAPAELGVDSKTYNSASLSWDSKSAGANGYKIALTSATGAGTFDWKDESTAIYQAKGLTPETEYTFKVKYKGGSGQCDFSDVETVDFTTGAIPAQFTVHYMDEDGTTPLGSDELVVVGEHPVGLSPAPTKPLFTLAAWQLSGSDIALDDASWASVAANAEVTLTARWAKAYATSYDMEAYAASDGASKEGLEAALTAANYAYTNINGIDNGHTHNYTYDGMKYKTNDGDLSFNVVAGKVVEVKTGHLPSNDAVTMYINSVADATVFEGADESQETHKTNYFYSAVEALYRLDVLASKGTCSVKKITIRDPYEVSYNPHGADAIAPQYGTPSVTLPTPVNGTGTFKGWYDAAEGGNKIGNAGASYTPTANITLHAQWETVSSDNTLSDLKVGGVTVDGFDPAVNTYYVVLPYGTAVGDIPAISATANSPKAKQVAIQQAVWTDEPYNCYRAQANVQAEDESWGYYDVRFSFAPKDGVSIIKVATTGGTNKTVTGAYAGDGDVNLSSSKKMDNGKYIGFSLDGTTLQAGDKINVHTSTAANTGGSHIIFYDNMTDKNELYDTEEIGGLGDNIFTINAAMVGATTAYVYRSNADAAHQWNGYVDYIEVTRAMDPVLTAITIDTRDGVIDPLDDKHFFVIIPYESDLAALTVLPTVIRNAAHATTPEAVVSNAGAWIIGDNTYRVMDKDGDYTDYTITLDRDVLKHTVSFNTHGGSVVASEEVEHGAYLAAAPAAPTKEENVFKFWSLTDGGEEVDVTTVQINADKEFHAVWEAEPEGIKLFTNLGLNTTNFISAAKAEDSVVISEVKYPCLVNFASNRSSLAGAKQGDLVMYSATTDAAKIKFDLYNANESAKTAYVWLVEEGDDAATQLDAIEIAGETRVKTAYYEFNGTKNRTVYLTSGSKADIKVLQAKVIESGAAIKQFGDAGYTLNLNKGRIASATTAAVPFEGATITVSSEYSVLNSSNLATKAANSFNVTSPVIMHVERSGGKYYVYQDPEDKGTLYSANADIELNTTGTWYISSETASSAASFTLISFAAPKCEKPVFNALANSNICSGDPYVALDGTGTVTDGGSITYKWYAEGGTDVLGTNATYTPSADGNYYVVALHHVDGFTDNEATSDVVSVTHYASAAITTAPEDQRVDVGSNATLSVVASGKAPLTYQWYTCDDALGTNPVIIAGAESDTYVVAVTAGLNQYYKVVVSSGCGEASAVALVEEWTELPQLDVTESMTWDWTYAGENNKLVAGKNVEVVMANIKENGKQPTNDATFRSQALLFYGENVRATEGGRNYASIGHISFNTTVPGIVKVEFSDNGSNDRRLKINDYMSESSSSKTDVKTFAAYVNAGNVTLMGVDEDGSGTNKYIRISKIIFTANPTPDYTRNVTNNIGTLCVDHNVLAGGAVGATFYQIASRSEQYNDKIDFEEVLPGEELKAGEPYIFQSTTGRIDLFYGATVADDPVAVRGMHGVLADGSSLTITEENKMDVYYIQDNKLRDCSNLSSLTLVKNRAYIVMSEVPTFAEYQAAQTSNPAPRRRVTLGRDAEQVATGCENLNVSDKPVKMILNGQLFILRGEKMFDATGRLVK